MEAQRDVRMQVVVDEHAQPRDVPPLHRAERVHDRERERAHRVHAFDDFEKFPVAVGVRSRGIHADEVAALLHPAAEFQRSVALVFLEGDADAVNPAALPRRNFFYRIFAEDDHAERERSRGLAARERRRHFLDGREARARGIVRVPVNEKADLDRVDS